MTTTPEQIEAVARAMWLSQYPSLTWELDANSTAKIEFRVLASAAITAMRPFIRAEALEEAVGPILQVPSFPDGYIMPPDNLKTAQDWELDQKLEDFAVAAFTKHHSVAVAYLQARKGNRYSSRDIQMMCQGWALAECKKAAAIRALKEKNDA